MEYFTSASANLEELEQETQRSRYATYSSENKQMKQVTSCLIRNEMLRELLILKAIHTGPNRDLYKNPLNSKSILARYFSYLNKLRQLTKLAAKFLHGNTVNKIYSKEQQMLHLGSFEDLETRTRSFCLQNRKILTMADEQCNVKIKRRINFILAEINVESLHQVENNVQQQKPEAPSLSRNSAFFPNTTFRPRTLAEVIQQLQDDWSRMVYTTNPWHVEDVFQVPTIPRIPTQPQVQERPSIPVNQVPQILTQPRIQERPSIPVNQVPQDPQVLTQPQVQERPSIPVNHDLHKIDDSTLLNHPVEPSSASTSNARKRPMPQINLSSNSFSYVAPLNREGEVLYNRVFTPPAAKRKKVLLQFKRPVTPKTIQTSPVNFPRPYQEMVSRGLAQGTNYGTNWTRDSPIAASDHAYSLKNAKLCGMCTPECRQQHWREIHHKHCLSEKNDII